MRNRHPALALVLAAVLAGAACGSDGAAPTAPAPSPAAISAAASNMRLLAHLDLAALTATAAPSAQDGSALAPAAVSGAGNWGYTTASGRRFALTGTSAGTSIVEVSDPARPVVRALVAGPASQWREIKTYGEYVYVTTEAPYGIDIISMKDPDHPAKVRTWDRTVLSAHSLWIDPDSGLLFANGANGRNGGMHILDVGANPEDPEDVGTFADFYVHDSYSRGGTLFASAIYDGFLALLDVSDPRRVREITRFATGGRFTHNAWLTRDGRYVFTTDERPGRPLEGWDIADPLAPRKVSEYIAAPGTIPHNVMVDGDRLLVAHYTEGVHLLDVRDPEHLRLLGSYDTFPGESVGFNGTWGAYVFPGSNLILASDITGGLFVIQYTGP